MRYDPEIALRLALLSDCAYADTGSGEAEEAAERLTGADQAIGIDFGSVEIVVARYGFDVALAFRGSSEPDDFLHDLRIGLVERDSLPGRTHRGFAAGVVDTYEPTREVVEGLLGVDGFLDVGGHSKGGAEALLMSYLFKKFFGPSFRTCHTFGAPAVGDKDFAKDFDRAIPETFSHVFGSDLVARSPVLLRAFGVYARTGRTVYHTRSGRILFRPSPIRSFLDGVRGVSRRLGRRDHGLGNYVDSLERGGRR